MRNVLPIRDINPTTRSPFVTWILIGGCVGVWLYMISLGDVGYANWVDRFGFIPLRITLGDRWWTSLTSMFLHAGAAHLLGNVWFLHIFGDNVEDELGHARYTLLYVGSGLIAIATHYLLSPMSPIPTIGASGAIAGVLGAYMMRFPQAPILSWFAIWIVELPAWVFLVTWFGYQLWMTIGSVGGVEQGVAFAAHVGGFVGGAVLVRLLAPASRLARGGAGGFRLLETRKIQRDTRHERHG